MSVVFDIYIKNSVFHKRSKVIYEGKEAFIPTEQVKVFKELCDLHPDISKAIKNNGYIYINGIKEDVYLKVCWQDDSTLKFSIDRPQGDILGFFNLHWNNLFT